MPDTLSPILITGSLVVDRVAFEGMRTVRPGGVVWYAASAIADLGMPVRVVTRTAPQDRFLLDPLVDAGVEVFWKSSAATTTLGLDYEVGNPSVRELRVESLAEAIPETLLEGALEGVRLLYLGPIHGGDLDPACLGAIRRCAPPRIALDAQGLLRRRENGLLVPGRDATLGDWLGVTDVLKVSEMEARVLLDDARVNRASVAQALGGRLDVPEIVVTCGIAGAWIWHEGAVSHTRARPVAADPTGAGDLFFAAYLSRRETGDPAGTAARFAATHVETALAGRARRAR